ncbi:MAG: HIT family protein [Firmicutes bacterium]|nr:HIT family protein [Bacillota bacterium]
MEDCIFCKIINGDLPSYKLYEDDLFYVMLDKFPRSLGHTLILTKSHSANIFELSPQESDGVFTLTKKIATFLRANLPAQDFNILQNNGKAAGQEVAHFHIHIVPRYPTNAAVPTKDKISTQHFEDIVDKFKNFAVN